MRTKLTGGSLALLILVGMLVGCDSAPDSHASSTAATVGLVTTVAPTTATPTTTVAPTTTESTVSLAEQQQRYEDAHGRGNGGIMVDLVSHGPDAWDDSADIIARGTVVEVSPLPLTYCAFYLEPAEVLKATSPIDGPIQFILFGDVTLIPVRPGDELLVIATWEQPASTVAGYLPIGYAWGVFMQVGDEYVSIMDPSMRTTPEAVREMLLTAD